MMQHNTYLTIFCDHRVMIFQGWKLLAYNNINGNEFEGVPSGQLGRSLASAGLDGGDVVGAVRDPGGGVFDGLLKAGLC